MSFDDAFRATVGHEGGYKNDPRDAGGETKYGISKRAYPKLDIRRLTLDDAKAIYRRDYWDRIRGDELPRELAMATFDAAVNSGVGMASRWLQKAVGATPDGKIGPLTMAAVEAAHPATAAARLMGHRLKMMTEIRGIKGWSTFGRGWAARVAENLKAL